MLTRLILFINILASLAALVFYVLQALALYNIAKRRGLENAWLAWIPVGNDWMLGAVADHYQRITKGKNKKKRVWLLGLNLALVAVTVVCVVLMIVMIVSTVMNVAELSSTEEMLEMIVGNIGLVLVFVLFALAVSGLSIALTVLRWVAMYDVFQSCDPHYAQSYFWVSLLVSLLLLKGTESVFLLVCSQKDYGMIPLAPPACSDTV